MKNSENPNADGARLRLGEERRSKKEKCDAKPAQELLLHLVKEFADEFGGCRSGDTVLANQKDNFGSVSRQQDDGKPIGGCPGLVSARGRARFYKRFGVSELAADRHASAAQGRLAHALQDFRDARLILAALEFDVRLRQVKRRDSPAVPETSKGSRFGIFVRRFDAEIARDSIELVVGDALGQLAEVCVARDGDCGGQVEHAVGTILPACAGLPLTFELGVDEMVRGSVGEGGEWLYERAERNGFFEIFPVAREQNPRLSVEQ